MPNSVKSLEHEAIEAAYQQFEQSGALSMRKVGEALGVSAAALYYHFANKQALLDAVSNRAFSAFEKQLRSIEAKVPEEVIRGILDEYRRFAADHESLFGLMFVEKRRAARKFPADFEAHRSAVFNLLWTAVGECLSRGGEPDSGEALHVAHDMWALTHGQILLWRAGRFPDERTFHEVLVRSINRFIKSL